MDTFNERKIFVNSVSEFEINTNINTNTISCTAQFTYHTKHITIILHVYERWNVYALYV